MVAERLEVGRVVRAHGIRGEVVVEAVSNRPERFAAGSVLLAGDDALTVVRAGRHGGPAPAGRMAADRFIVAFEGVTTRTGAETLRGVVLRADAGPSGDADVLWVHELVGAALEDTAGTALGRVTAVEANPASDLLVTDSGGLIPMTFVVEATPGRVVVDPPPGLLDP